MVYSIDVPLKKNYHLKIKKYCICQDLKNPQIKKQKQKNTNLDLMAAIIHIIQQLGHNIFKAKKSIVVCLIVYNHKSRKH